MVITLAWLECGYRNGSDRMVIVRCVGPEQFFLERVVFPFELLSFSCPADSEVKIWTHGLGGPELLETIAVAELVITDSPEAAPDQGTPAPPAGETMPPGEAMPPTIDNKASPSNPTQISFGGDLVEAWAPAV